MLAVKNWSRRSPVLATLNVVRLLRQLNRQHIDAWKVVCICFAQLGDYFGVE
jgi:hypothetical protein